MLLNRATRRKLLPLGVLLAPALAVQLFRLASGAQPATGHAALSPIENPEAIAIPPVPPMKADQTRALAWLRSRSRDRIERSPMDHPPAEALPPAPPPPLTEPDPEQPRPLSTMKTRPELRSIMAAPRETIATINGRIMRVGDEVEPGWRIVAIDVSTMTVMIEGPEKQAVELTRDGLHDR